MIPADRDLNTVTADEWRAATEGERRAFLGYWSRRGIASYCCLNCGFPTVHGQAGCEACRPVGATQECQ